ncbi:MAG: LysM peptidoglycan-binding domain-containing protein, partial [Endomicrobiia bacterium]
VFGIVIENINQPYVGFYTTETLPMELKLGYKYLLENLNFFATVGMINSIKTQNWFGVAVEYDFILFKILKLTPSLGINFGSDNYLMSYLGFLTQTEKFAMSYSISIDPLDKIGLIAQHKISFGYKFVPVPIENQTVTKTEYDNIVVERNKLVSQIERLKTEIKLLQEKSISVEKKEIKQKQPKIVEVQKEVQKTEKKEEKPANIKQEVPVVPPIKQQPISVTEPIQEKPAESDVKTTEQMLLEKLRSLEQKLQEVDKKKTEPTKPSVIPQPVPQQQQVTPKKRFHTVVSGDSLPAIAQKYYGDSSKWKIIYEANKEKIIRGQLLPGTVLEIP